jgi:hypothetical protein
MQDSYERTDKHDHETFSLNMYYMYRIHKNVPRIVH